MGWAEALSPAALHQLKQKHPVLVIIGLVGPAETPALHRGQGSDTKGSERLSALSLSHLVHSWGSFSGRTACVRTAVAVAKLRSMECPGHTCGPGSPRGLVRP